MTSPDGAADPAWPPIVEYFAYSKSLPTGREPQEDFRKKRRPNYGEGEGEVLTLTFVSVFSVFSAGDGFTIVVLLSFFSAGGFVTVVSFCSQAASNAAPAKMQMYFFIGGCLTDELRKLFTELDSATRLR